MNSLSYQNCYDILSLANDASWEDASLSYRRLVQRWHPDRYEGVEQDGAEKRFIQITKAYNKLKIYHQQNKTLPFASVKADIPDSSLGRGGTNSSRTANSQPHRAPSSGNHVHKRISPVVWIAGIAFFVGGVILLIMISQLEKKSSEKNRESARMQRVMEQEKIQQERAESLELEAPERDTSQTLEQN